MEDVLLRQIPDPDPKPAPSSLSHSSSAGDDQSEGCRGQCSLMAEDRNPPEVGCGAATDRGAYAAACQVLDKAPCEGIVVIATGVDATPLTSDRAGTSRGKERGAAHSCGCGQLGRKGLGTKVLPHRGSSLMVLSSGHASPSPPGRWPWRGCTRLWMETESLRCADSQTRSFSPLMGTSPRKEVAITGENGPRDRARGVRSGLSRRRGRGRRRGAAHPHHRTRQASWPGAGGHPR